MAKKNFHITITINASVEEAMEKVNQVNLWWTKKTDLQHAFWNFHPRKESFRQ